MEENKLIKSKVGLVQRVGDVIGITNKLLKDIPILVENDLVNKGFKFVGGNAKHIVILLNECIEEDIQQTSMEYLMYILTPCKLELDDVAIIKITNEEVDLIKIINFFSPKVILLFGIKNPNLNPTLNLKVNQIFSYNQCKILLAPTWNLIFIKEYNRESEKMKLWYNLKSVLNLKMPI